MDERPFLVMDERPFMNTFDGSTVIPEAASKREKTYDGILAAGRRAVLDQFGNVDVVRGRLR
jgi:hypothetical protein